MKNYHIATKIALVLDCILVLICIAQMSLVPHYSAWGLSNVLGVLGIVALLFCIIGHIKRSTKLGIVLIIINTIFSLGLLVLTGYILEVMIQRFYISVPVMLLFLVEQLYLCIKMDSIRIKYAPVYVVIAVSIFAGLLTIAMGIAEELDLFVLSIYLGACVVMPGLIGVVVAWVVYRIYMNSRSKK